MRPVDWNEVIRRLTVVFIDFVCSKWDLGWIAVLAKNLLLKRPGRPHHVEDRALLDLTGCFLRLVYQLLEVRR
jgi:hypothetical protein